MKETIKTLPTEKIKLKEELFNDSLPAEDLEKNLDQILNLDQEGLLNFLDFLAQYKNRHDLKEKTIEEIITRCFELAANLPEGAYWNIFLALDDGVQLHGEFKNKSQPPLSITDKTMLALKNIYAKFPNLTENFWELFYQGNTVKPEIMLNVLKDMNADSNVDENWRSRTMGILQEKIGYDGYEKYLQKDLLAESKENNFYKQLKWIKFLKQIFIESYLDNNYATDEAFNNLEKVFETATEKLPNHLLKKYLARILETPLTKLDAERYLNIDKQGQPHFYDTNGIPEDALEREEEDKKYTPRQLANIRFRKKYNFGIQTISADFSGAFNRYRDLKYTIDADNKIEDVESVLTNNLRLDMAAEEKEKISPAALDFQVLADPFFRELIKKETGVDLINLDLQTQFWFMDFIKNTTDEKFATVAQFVKKHGIAGIKAFLTLEYQQNNGQNILTMAEKLSEAEAQIIFHEHALLLDKIAVLKNNLKKYLSEQSGDLKIKNFPEQLTEGLRRRVSDIFLATHYLLTNKTETELNTTDTEKALSAINLLLTMVEDFKKQENFSFNLDRREQMHQTVATEESEKRQEYLLRDKKTGEEYRLRFFTRPKANEHGEARFSLSLSFEGAGIKKENKKLKEFFASSQINLDTGKIIKNKSELSIRIDLDSHYQPPKMSLDFGRAKRQEKNIAYTGDRLGNLLHITTEIGNHNIKSFDPQFGQPEIFAQLIKLMDEYLTRETAPLPAMEKAA